MRVGVVGHLEVVEFAVVERLPRHGEIVHALESFTAVAGGSPVVAVVMRELAGAASLWTAVGTDALGDAAVAELRDIRRLEVAVARRDAPTRRAFTHLAQDGARTITVIGERLAPLGADGMDLGALDAVFLTAADAALVRLVRAAARVVVATPRVGPALREAGIAVDVLVGSATDPGEDLDVAGWPAPPAAVVATAGAAGGTWRSASGERGSWPPEALPAPFVDDYGCGDAFAAGLTVALGQGASLADACTAGARAGARRAVLRGPYGQATPHEAAT